MDITTTKTAAPAISIVTNLNSFDPVTDSYNGWVSVTASPRVGVSFNVSLMFNQAKNEKDALAQVKESLDKVVEDIHESAAAH